MNRRNASSSPVYPFTAIVGQEEMKQALLLSTIDPAIGGVLVMGHRGTGKSTAVRALADLLPLMTRVRACVFGCDPKDVGNLCEECAARLSTDGKLKGERVSVPVVDLPLGATEDRVCGTINIERALKEGVKAFEPGLLARAHRGFLYIDEVNLLEDHLVDLLLDVTVTGRNLVEREGISIEHPARFVLVGSGNPEEGELRPQLLDRFGLHVEVRTVDDLDQRVLIVERRDMFERDASRFLAEAHGEQERLRRKLLSARRSLMSVTCPRPLLRRVAELCLRLNVDGHRGELTIARAARALAAFEGRRVVSEEDVRRVASMALRHRLRRDPLEQTASAARIDDALEQLFPTSEDNDREAETQPKKASPNRGKHKKGGNDNGAGGARDVSASQHVSPAPDARLADSPQDQRSSSQRRRATPEHSFRQRRNSGHGSYNPRGGRYARAVTDSNGEGRIALDATLRAAAQMFASTPLVIDKEALRYKRFRRKAGALFIFAVDASGSMALNRIAQVKGALGHLLQRSYVRRDRVALVSFRGQTAELLLPPCQSVARARRLLDALAVGGATPLSAGLSAAIEVARRAARHGIQDVSLLIFTDGRANVSLRVSERFDRETRRRVIEQELAGLGALLRRAGVQTTVVDTQNRFVSNGEAERLAVTLGGRHTSLSPNATWDAQ